MEETDRLAALEAKIASLMETVATKDARIAELERLLEEVRRSGKRQSAPFSKGKPKEGGTPRAARRARPSAVTVFGRRPPSPTASLMPPYRSAARTAATASTSSAGPSSPRPNCRRCGPS